MGETAGVPDVYTHGHQEAVLRSHKWRTVENSAAYLLPHLVRGRRLLDVGCGPGTITVDFARRLDPGAVVGVDIAESVIEEAWAAAGGAGVRNVEFVSGDFREVLGGVEPFDIVHAHQVLQHVSDPVGCLQAMAGYCRPGGVVAARDSDYTAFTWARGSELMERWLEIYVSVARENQAEPDAGRWLLSWAQQAGLQDITYTTTTWTFATPEDRAWWGGLWADRCLTSSFAEQAVRYGITTDEELAQIADAWRAWATEPDAVFIVPHGELLARV